MEKNTFRTVVLDGVKYSVWTTLRYFGCEYCDLRKFCIHREGGNRLKFLCVQTFGAHAYLKKGERG